MSRVRTEADSAPLDVDVDTFSTIMVVARPADEWFWPVLSVRIDDSGLYSDHSQASVHGLHSSAAGRAHVQHRPTPGSHGHLYRRDLFRRASKTAHETPSDRHGTSRVHSSPRTSRLTLEGCKHEAKANSSSSLRT